MELTNLNKDRKKQKRRQDETIAGLVYGKIPPQAKDVEGAILGAIMLEVDAFDRAAELLQPGTFYVDAHQRIFAAMQQLRARNMAIDYHTLTEELKKNGDLDAIGGEFYLVQLTNQVVSSANIEQHSRIVIQKWIQREQIRIGGLCLQLGYNEGIDPFEARDEIEEEWTQLYQGHSKSNYVPVTKGLINVVQKIEANRQRLAEGNKLTGIPSGFANLDQFTFGFQPTDLIILAARPSMGKTAFALNMARNAARAGHSVGFFSLEMSTDQLICRALASMSEINLERILRGYLTDEAMKQLYQTGIQALSKLKIHFNDDHSQNIYDMKSAIRTMKRKEGIGIVFIDYLQLMAGMDDSRSYNRNDELSKITRDLKGLAKELKIPIVALSQLSRDVEKRKGDGKMPILADLRDSGAIEQDADLAMFMYRPEYYEQGKPDLEGTGITGETFVRIAKHRNGRLGQIKFRAQLEFQQFIDSESVEGKRLEQEANKIVSGPPPALGVGSGDNDDLPF